MSKTPLTIHDHGTAIMLSESIALMAQGLRETYLDHGLKYADKTAEHTLSAGLNLISFAAKNLCDHVERAMDELEPNHSQDPSHKEAGHG